MKAFKEYHRIMQSKVWNRKKRNFSCKRFFETIDKKSVIKKFYVNEKCFNGACRPDFISPEDTDDFQPLEHLIECHGFMHNVPAGKKRSLEIRLCKMIEKSMEVF